MNTIARLLTGRRTRLAVVITTFVVVATAGAAAAGMVPGGLRFTGTTGAPAAVVPSPDPCDPSLDLPYVAAGDGVPAGAKKTDGTDGTDKDSRYPAKLVKKLDGDGFP